MPTPDPPAPHDPDDVLGVALAGLAAGVCLFGVWLGNWLLGGK